MKQIKNVIASPGLTGFFFDDQAAIKNNAVEDGATYYGKIETPGFSNIRQAGESISIMLILDDGQVAYGDCAAVQYSGTGGRDPLFLAKEFISIINKEIAHLLIGKDLKSFKSLAELVDNYSKNGCKLHTAIRYGVTQALLDAVAKAKYCTRTEVVLQEYGLKSILKPIPIFCQTGDDRYLNADKIIIKHADVLPHGLINNVDTKLGKHGEKLLGYIKWLKERIKKIGDENYEPIFHVDVYGTIGLAFNNNLEEMVDYLLDLEKVSSPFKIRIEGPVDVGSKTEQIKSLKLLRNSLKESNSSVEIVADEWCNSLEDIKDFVDAEAADMVQIKTPDLGGINNIIEAVLYCKQHGIGAYQGGTCNETDRSAQICTDIALATRPNQVLAKPGMGVDEGLMIVYNEMQRILTLLKYKDSQGV